MLGGLISGLFGSGSAKTPPYQELAEANLKAGDFIDSATTRNVDDLENFLGLSDTAYQPWIEAGHTALSDIMDGMESGAFDAGEFMAPRYSDLGQDPAYQFRVAEGMRGLRRQNAAMGLGDSGAHMRAAMELGQGMASDEYDKMYGRAVNQYQMKNQLLGNRFNRLAGLQSGGQDALRGQMDNRLKATDMMGRNRLTGADARGNAEIGYWNSLIDRQNFKNQRKADKWGGIGSSFDTAASVATGYFL